jgi:hypothetical protein
MAHSSEIAPAIDNRPEKEVHMYHGPFPRPCVSFFLLLLTLPLTAGGTSPAAKRAEPASTTPGLSSLPIQAQASISAALGRDQRAYHAKREGRAWRLDNPKHGLRADFTTRGVDMQSGAARFRLRLTGLGRGARLESVAAAKPEAKSNRIDYRRGALSEWYVNGPLGLEQGFTLDTPPARKGSEALTLALRLSGDLSAVPDPRGEGMALQARGGGTALRYRGLVAWDRTGRPLPAWWQGQGSEVRLRLDDGGARYPLTVDPIIEDAKIVASDGEADDGFGSSVAVDGDTVVVGAPEKNIDGRGCQGAAYVFVASAGRFVGSLQENARLTASDAATARGCSFFGSSVAVNADTIVVGMPPASFGPGSALVFVKPAGGWAGQLTEQAELIASDGMNFDDLGVSVAMSGDTVVVGASGNDIGNNSGQGSAYVFVKPPTGWAGMLRENALLTASDGAADDRFGRAVALHNDTAVIGALSFGSSGNLNDGAAYVFVEPAGGWVGPLTENAKLTASNPPAGNIRFGTSVSVSGDTIVAGVLASGPAGAFVFVKPAGGWAGVLTETAKLTPGGVEVAISGDTVAAGLPPFVYRKPSGGRSGTLTANAIFTTSDNEPFDFFPPFFGIRGNKVALSGDTLVAGAAGDDIGGNADQGSAYVFDASTFEAEPATTRIDCKTAGCKLLITCNLAQTCTNRITLLVRARDVRLREETRARAPRMIRFASAVANIPPGVTRAVRLKLTKTGRDVVSEKKKKKLKGIIEIRNTPGTAFDRTPITIRLR